MKKQTACFRDCILEVFLVEKTFTSWFGLESLMNVLERPFEPLWA